MLKMYYCRTGVVARLRLNFSLGKIGFWILEIVVTICVICLLTNQLTDFLDYHQQNKPPFYLGLRSLEEESPSPIQGNVTINREFFNYLTANLRDTAYPGADNYTRYAVGRLGLTPLIDVNPLIPEFGPVVNDVLSFRYPISVPPCALDDDAAVNNRKVFIAINSAPYNFDKREMTRQTWKNLLKTDDNNIPTGLMSIAGFGFFLGLTDNKKTQRKIEQESETHGDIIQTGIFDFYRNLMIKKAGLVNWLHRNCGRIDFVLMVDDDIYVNVRELAHFVQSHNQSENPSMFGTPPLSSNDGLDGQWEITFEEWPWTYYPPYFNGPAVLMTGSAIRPLLACFQTTPMLLRAIDDVYISGICPGKTSIKTHFPTDSFSVLEMEFPGECKLRHVLGWKCDNFTRSHLETADSYRRIQLTQQKNTQC